MGAERPERGARRSCGGHGSESRWADGPQELVVPSGSWRPRPLHLPTTTDSPPLQRVGSPPRTHARLFAPVDVNASRNVREGARRVEMSAWGAVSGSWTAGFGSRLIADWVENATDRRSPVPRGERRGAGLVGQPCFRTVGDRTSAPPRGAQHSWIEGSPTSPLPISKIAHPDGPTAVFVPAYTPESTTVEARERPLEPRRRFVSRDAPRCRPRPAAPRSQMTRAGCGVGGTPLVKGSRLKIGDRRFVQPARPHLFARSPCVSLSPPVALGDGGKAPRPPSAAIREHERVGSWTRPPADPGKCAQRRGGRPGNGRS